MIKTLKAKIKDNGYMATNKDWLDAMIESTFHDLILPEHVTKKTVAEAFYKDMASLDMYKDDCPKCIMFKDGSVDLFEQLGYGIAIIDGYGNADPFRDFCVSHVSSCKSPFFARGLCNAIRAVSAYYDMKPMTIKVDCILGEDEYIRYAVPMPFDRIEDGWDLDVELIAFEHEGDIKLVIPHIDTEADLENLRHLAGSGIYIYWFGVFHSSDGPGGWKLQELSKVLEEDAFLVKPHFEYRGVYDSVVRP